MNLIITIPEYKNHVPTQNVITIEVPWVCNSCGGPRGLTTKHKYFGYWIDSWKNACQHFDYYETIVGEAIVSLQGAVNYFCSTPEKIGNFPTKNIKYDGQFCIGCKEYYPMAAPNLPNNQLKCWSCRNSA